LGQQETAIHRVLRKAQAEGVLNPARDARALARFFLGVAWGINAVNRTVADPEVLRDMVRAAMSVGTLRSFERPPVSTRPKRDRQFESPLLQQRGTANRRLRWFIVQHRDEVKFSPYTKPR
jgi:hypothetical protein